jgi:hypothetical protein
VKQSKASSGSAPTVEPVTKLAVAFIAMDVPDFDRMAAVVAELEEMCRKAKELRIELDAARNQGRFWRGSRDVNKHVSPRDNLAEQRTRKATSTK